MCLERVRLGLPDERLALGPSNAGVRKQEKSQVVNQKPNADIVLAIYLLNRYDCCVPSGISSSSGIPSTVNNQAVTVAVLIVHS